MLILFTGFMGSGKSTVGVKLASKLGYDFKEFDQLVLDRTGFKTIGEVYKHRKSFWKESELEVSKELSSESNLVLACGGGFFDNDLNYLYFQEKSKDLKVIYLKATAETLSKRNSHASKSADQKKIQKNIENLYLKRDILYTEKADLIIDTDEKTPEEIISWLMKEKFNEFSIENLHLYQKLFVMTLDPEQKFFYHEVLPYLNYLLVIAVLIELTIEGKVSITTTGPEIVEHWYVPKDKILRNVFYSITVPRDEYRMGAELQHLSNLNGQQFYESVLENLEEKRMLKKTVPHGLWAKRDEKIELSFPYIREELDKYVLKVVDHPQNCSDHDMAFALLLKNSGLAEKLMDKANYEKLIKATEKNWKGKETEKLIALLDNELRWAGEYFAF